MNDNGKEREEAESGRIASFDIDRLEVERVEVGHKIAEATARLEELTEAIDLKKAQSEFEESFPREEEYWEPDEERLQEVQLALSRNRVPIKDRLRVLKTIPQDRWKSVWLRRSYGEVRAVQVVVSLPEDELRLVRIKKSFNQHDGLSHDLEITPLSPQNLPTTEEELKPKTKAVFINRQWSSGKFTKELEDLYEGIASGIESS